MGGVNLERRSATSAPAFGDVMVGEDEIVDGVMALGVAERKVGEFVASKR